MAAVIKFLLIIPLFFAFVTYFFTRTELGFGEIYIRFLICGMIGLFALLCVDVFQASFFTNELQIFVF